MASHESEPMSPRSPSRAELLELDMDIRLSELWEQASREEHWDLEKVGQYMRAAYGRGYCDNLREDDSGKLIKDHGYKIPEPLPAPPESETL